MNITQAEIFQNIIDECTNNPDGSDVPFNVRAMASKALLFNGPISQEEFVRARGSICPVCKSESIDQKTWDNDGDHHWLIMYCNECGATWSTIYTLARYDHIND